MYIHLGNETLIRTDEIIGIFDLDSTTVSKHTRKFLNEAEKRGEVLTVTYELPKAFVVCQNKKNRKSIYLTQLSSTTLEKRAETKLGIRNEE